MFAMLEMNSKIEDETWEPLSAFDEDKEDIEMEKPEPALLQEGEKQEDSNEMDEEFVEADQHDEDI